MPPQPSPFGSAPPPNTTAQTQLTHDRPFLIQLRQEDKTPSGSFRPAASMQLGESLRSSGLLFFLAPEDLKSLLFLLTFLSPNGECQAALHQLAAAMRVSSFKAQRRMRRLVAFVWNNESLVLERKRESGLVYYRPHPHLIAFESWSAPEPVQPMITTVPRDDVIAYSRERYGRPREEVEREMAQRMGWDKDQREQDEKAAQLQDEVQMLTPHARDVLQRLQTTGLTIEQALDLLRTFDIVRIERQLLWLPYRHAKNPAGFLLAAIADNYEAPPALRHVAIPAQDIAPPLAPMPDEEFPPAEEMPIDGRVLEMPSPAIPRDLQLEDPSGSPATNEDALP